MADQTLPPRPAAMVAADGTLSNPDGWSLILVAADRETVVAGWDDAGTFWQWEDTETIVKDLMEALEQMQQTLTMLVS